MDNFKLSNRRKEKGLTQQVIAKLMGLSTKSYNRKELCLIEFTRKEISDLANILELTIEDVNDIFFGNLITKR